MSEKIIAPAEQPKNHESAYSKEIPNSKEIPKNKVETAKQASHEHAENINEIRHNVYEQAISAEKYKSEKAEQQPTVQHITKELKNIRYKETMHYVRRHLKPGERKFSTFVHTPTVEKISEVGAKTVARPSGLLGGGLVALIGSVGTLYIANRYGFEVPNSLFMALFVIGFGIGLLGEFIVFGFSMRHNNRYKKYKGHR